MSRPSAVGYNAAGSAGSNKGPTNPDYLKDVQSRIDSFLVHNKSIQKEQIPAELVTASGSGLDPDISPEGAIFRFQDRCSQRDCLLKKYIRSLIQSIQRSTIWNFRNRKSKCV